MRMFIEVVFKDNKANGVKTDINKLNRSLNKFVMLRLPKLYSGETMKDELAELFSFFISDLDWTVDLVITMQDKVKVISPLQLKEKVKLRIKKMSEIYKDDI